MRFIAIGLAAASLGAQVPAAPRSDTAIAVTPISAPKRPLPTEAASASVTKFSFIAYGDTRGRFDGTALQVEHGMVITSMLKTIASMSKGPDPVRFVVQSGDAVVSGREAQQLNVSYTPLVNRITTEAGIPYFLAVGNHDVTGSSDLTNPGRQLGLANYYAAQKFLIPSRGPRRMPGYPTYAFGYGNTFFLAFDSNIAGDSAQFMWVKSQLEHLNRKRFVNVVVFFHHPPFSTGPHGGPKVESQAVELRTRYMPLFRKHNVRLLLTGHEHLFEHFVERWRDSTGRAHRMDQIVSGGGGAPTYTYSGEADLTQYEANTGRDSARVQHLVRPGATEAENPYHYIVVHVDGAKISIEVIAADPAVAYQPYRTSKFELSSPQ